MIKNPSFCTLLDLIKTNLAENSGTSLTLACVVSQCGNMLIYRNASEALSMVSPPSMPDEMRTIMFKQVLRNAHLYFYHVSYEYVPELIPGPVMEARIMMWWEALRYFDIKVVANTMKEDRSGQSFMTIEKMIEEKKELERMGLIPEVDVDGTFKFMDDFNLTTLLDRRTTYNDEIIYCVKLNPPQQVQPADPCIRFVDTKNRPAVARKPLAEFLHTYQELLPFEDRFDIFVYPDGTGANVTGYVELELDTLISDKDAIDRLHMFEVIPEDMMEFESDARRKYYKLQLLKIVHILHGKVAAIPYPVTPQQAVFLEGIQELGFCTFEEMNIIHLTDISDCSIQIIPTTTGFLYGATESFFPYDILHPMAQKHIESVVKNIEDIKDEYLFDATRDDRLFVVRTEATL